MKLIIIISLMIFACSAEAFDLPCKSEVLKYDMPDKGFIDICKDNKNIISFNATATVESYQCGMGGKAKLVNNKYKHQGKRGCTVIFNLNDNKLVVEFKNCDNSYYCGSAAYWTDGEYLRDDF